MPDATFHHFWAESPDHIVVHFVFRFGLLLFYIVHAYVRFLCLCAFIGLFCAFSNVKKHAVCAFIVRPRQT